MLLMSWNTQHPVPRMEASLVYYTQMLILLIYKKDIFRPHMSVLFLSRFLLVLLAFFIIFYWFRNYSEDFELL